MVTGGDCSFLWWHVPPLKLYSFSDSYSEDRGTAESEADGEKKRGNNTLTAGIQSHDALRAYISTLQCLCLTLCIFEVSLRE